MDQPDCDIPKELHSEYEERPFRNCTCCGETLVDFDDGYQISKVYRNGECIMEYAICMPCHSNMIADFSEDSRQRMMDFQEEHFAHGPDLHTCVVCGLNSDQKKPTEYGLAAFCIGASPVQELMVCGVCSEKMQELISDETRQRWDRFVGEHFPCAPNEVAPAPAGGVPVF